MPLSLIEKSLFLFLLIFTPLACGGGVPKPSDIECEIVFLRVQSLHAFGFYHVEDGEDDRFYVDAMVDENRSLHFAFQLRMRDGQRSKNLSFLSEWDALIERFNGQFDTVTDYWWQPTDPNEISDNLEAFNEAMRPPKNLSKEDAAFETFSGKLLRRKGFTKVTVNIEAGTPGQATRVGVFFEKP